MKKLSLFLFVLFSVSTLGFEKSKGNGFVIWDGKKSDQIKFYLDLEINSKSPNKAIALIEEMVFFIKDLEPNTITYEYYITEDNKSISLREVYKNSEAALTHMNNFEELIHISIHYIGLEKTIGILMVKDLFTPLFWNRDT